MDNDVPFGVMLGRWLGLVYSLPMLVACNSFNWLSEWFKWNVCARPCCLALVPSAFVGVRLGGLVPNYRRWVHPSTKVLTIVAARHVEILLLPFLSLHAILCSVTEAVPADGYAVGGPHGWETADEKRVREDCEELALCEALTNYSGRCHRAMKEKGFYDVEKSAMVNMALIASEVGEAVEELRSPDRGPKEIRYLENNKPIGFPTELADIVIRCLDTAASQEIDLGRAIRVKQFYNRIRPHKHGGKLV